MKTKFLPVFGNISSLHRVFGDAVESTEIHTQENVLGPVLMQHEAKDGIVTLRVRTWFWRPTYARQGTITNRFECYFNGVLCDYTCERQLIVKTFRWLSKMGQIHQKTA